ncbi:signal transduction histidine kinase [Geodermatophilus sabuli]|uniref:histidine kinase n=1 Tax=Geodermatophilus sabuli TaxID=1564158 RepID=A0A285EB09_9ACTN|nr:sensor histidine kinase [Geodermatophilus sabuli]MBB3085413.1 signal transduction histidine kinase [Geodermatophilus sabuli]SNX96160.1 Signal transduction histidine kinase [Geodermatophilus sabuli]
MAAAAALTSVGALFSAEEAGSRAPDAVAVVLLVTAAASLLLRRHRPRTALFGTIGLTLSYLALDYPGGPELPVLMVAFYSVAAAGQRWETVLVVLLFGGGGALYRAFVEREPFLEIALTVALLVLAFLLGDSVSTRRRLRAEVRERLRAAAVEKELEAQSRVSGERVRIAQELHDVLAHTITTMTVHAGVAADLLSDRPEQARNSLATLRACGREAMAELRATIAVLRSGAEGPTREATPGLAQLDPLVRGVEEAGLPVDLEVRGERRDLPAAVELTAYRIVQEALTNVIRHARATRATVCVSVGRSAVEVTVADDGAGRADAPAHRGSGLLGLTERARALGGVLSAGNRPGGGFRVQATLPAPEADR